MNSKTIKFRRVQTMSITINAEELARLQRGMISPGQFFSGEGQDKVFNTTRMEFGEGEWKVEEEGAGAPDKQTSEWNMVDAEVEHKPSLADIIRDLREKEGKPRKPRQGNRLLNLEDLKVELARTAKAARNPRHPRRGRRSAKQH